MTFELNTLHFYILLQMQTQYDLNLIVFLEYNKY
jgi:hypothetical protein